MKITQSLVRGVKMETQACREMQERMALLEKMVFQDMEVLRVEEVHLEIRGRRESVESWGLKGALDPVVHRA